MNCMEEEKLYIDGIACPYLCHIQETEQAGNVFPAHFHYYIEILYALSGRFLVYLNGIYHEFEAGDIVLINSKEIHQIDALSENGGRYIVLRFLPDLIYNGISQSHFEMKYVLPFITENPGCEKVIKASNLSNSPIPALMHEIIAENESQNYGYELAIKNNISRIFLWILRYWHANEEYTLTSCQTDYLLQQQLAPALTYMTENYDKPVSATEMAKLCSLSYSYFSRSFNRLMNMKFSDYLNYIRIREAEKLLVSSSLSITEIAVTVGFGTTSYFIKLFKAYKHTSPKQYQKLLHFTPDTKDSYNKIPPAVSGHEAPAFPAPH